MSLFTDVNIETFRSEPRIIQKLDGIQLLNLTEFEEWFKPEDRKSTRIEEAAIEAGTEEKLRLTRMKSAEEKKLISEGKFSWQGDVYKAIFLILELFATKFKYATICDDNHYQMMIWDVDKGNHFFLPDSEVITRYEDDEYLISLRNGIPKKWNSTYLDKLV